MELMEQRARVVARRTDSCAFLERKRQGWAQAWLSGVGASARVLTVLLALLALFPIASPAARRLEVPQFLIVDYHAISKTRVADSPDHKPLYDYVYRVDVRNSGARAVRVTGQVTSRRPSVVVTDGAVLFGTVDSREIKTSEDTVTIRAGKFFDRRLDRKIQSNGRWRFEEEGTDPEDHNVRGLLQRSTLWLPDLLDVIYNLKFALIFDWQIQSQPDDSAPTISSTQPNGLLREEQPLISASYADAGGAIATAQVVLTVDGVDVTSQAAVSAASISYRPSAVLAQGAHSVSLRVPDTAGNVANASWSFTVDTVAPTIISTAPRDTSDTRPGVAITASYSDAVSGVDVSALRLVVDGQDVSSMAAVTPTELSYRPAAPFSGGQHEVSLSLTDAAGNNISTQWTFAVDATGPDITNTLPANGTELGADALPAIYAALVDSGSGIDTASVRLTVDGTDVTAQSQVTEQAVSYSPSAALSEGNHTVALTVSDRNGNASTAVWSFITRTAPEIYETAPKDVILNATSVVAITAAYRDVGSGIDVQSVRISVDGVDFTSEAQVTPSGLSLAPAVALPQGLHVVSLSVSDLAGNVSAAQWSFTIDTGLPYVDQQQPKNTLVNTTTPTITAAYADSGTPATGVDHSRTRLYVNGEDVTAQAQFNTTATPHLVTYTPTAALAAGSQIVRLVVADHAGNEIESLWSFTIDVEGPAIVDLWPRDGAKFSEDTLLTLSATFLDVGSAINPSSVRIEIDGSNVAAGANITAEGFTLTLANRLMEGAHTLVVQVSDLAGNQTVRTHSFVTESVPFISEQYPIDVVFSSGSVPVIGARLDDFGSGVDTSSVRLFVDGSDVTSNSQVTATGVSYTSPTAPGNGSHVMRLVVADLAGNVAESTWQFAIAPPPQITNVTPRDVLLTHGAQPTISAEYVDGYSAIDPARVRITLDGEDVTSLATVTGSSVAYTPATSLAAGVHTVHVQVASTSNAVASADWNFEVETQRTYAVAIIDPAGPVSAPNPRISVSATASANGALPESLTLNGAAMSLTGFGADGQPLYAGVAQLSPGLNLLTVVATFADGETRTATQEVAFDGQLKVTIVSPVDRSVFGRVNPTSPGDLTGNVERPITIAGTISRPVASVLINQQAAQVSASGTEFTFANFFLREGLNMITAVATDANGRVGSAAITVSVDQTAPILTVEAPLAQTVTSASRIDVRGIVNDAVEGLIGAPEPTVTVNGQAAQVFDRYYLASDVPLQVGVNSIDVVATDQLGNARTSSLQVTRIAVGSDRLTLASGNHQSGSPTEETAEPLTVIALSAAGEPLSNLPVKFDVMRGTGSISLTQGQPTLSDGATPARNLVFNTDAQGRAQVWLTLGKQSGPGANVVNASAPGIAEEVTFVATTQRGAVAKVLADTGINQFAETGAQPLELLSVVVRDREDNLLPNVPVVFQIDEGDGFFIDANNEHVQRVVMHTDKNGLTALRPTIGATPGLVRISAKALKRADGDIENPADLTGDATYLIQAKEARDGPASFSGRIYTDKGVALPGVRVSIGRTALSATTDAQGAFELTDVPPGRIDLFIDGRTSNHDQKIWPSLHFESFVVRGQQNQLAHPIYLPPLLMSEAKTVGGAEDVILTIPGLQGFQMKVKANSVTFPDGSRTGTLVVSPVTADRLPMAPPAGGATFGVPAWTIQPAGTRFDPPIEVRLPNSSGQPVGDNLPVVQWDHDLSQFVPMGRATVSEDGAYLITDAGSGVTKAGWGGLCVYDPDKCAKSGASPCTECEVTDSSGDCPTCRVDPAKAGKCCSDGRSVCKNGTCSPVRIARVDGTVNGKQTDSVPVTRPASFSAIASGNDCDYEYSWTFGDGGISTQQNPTHTYMTSGQYTATLTVKCKLCGSDVRTDTVIVNVVEVEKLQFSLNGAWMDVPSAGFSDIGLNTNITFKAVVKPAGATWPTGCPTWGGGDATGTAETTTATFARQGARVVSATCGKTVSKNVAVQTANVVKTITWQPEGYRAAGANAASTTVERTFTMRYEASADVGNNQWKLKVLDISGGVDIVVNTGGSRDPFTNPPINQAEAVAAVNEMKDYWSRGSRGSWHTEAASKAHELHHYTEWKCSSDHYWPPTETAIEALNVSYASYVNNSAGAMAALRGGASGADAKIRAYKQKSWDYWMTLADNARSRPYAAGQLVLNSAVLHVQALAATNHWVVPGGINTPSPANPCYQPWLPYAP